MKKLLLVLAVVFALMAGPAFAQDVWYNANQFTVGWNAVTTDIDGDPLLDVVSYEVLLANAVTDPNKINSVVVATTTALEATITLGVKGRYFVGVRAVHLDDKSDINWADEPANQEGHPLFGVRFGTPPKSPTGLVK